ncbi:hypothetical protein BDW02DRAFT_568029, partial [Decorospora gaudefroyi]
MYRNRATISTLRPYTHRHPSYIKSLNCAVRQLCNTTLLERKLEYTHLELGLTNGSYHTCSFTTPLEAILEAMSRGGNDCSPDMRLQAYWCATKRAQGRIRPRNGEKRCSRQAPASTTLAVVAVEGWNRLTECCRHDTPRALARSVTAIRREFGESLKTYVM